MALSVKAGWERAFKTKDVPSWLKANAKARPIPREAPVKIKVLATRLNLKHNRAMAQLRVLAICTHNSARSQILEGWLRHYGLEAASAGTEKTSLKPEAVAVMREAGLDISAQYSKTIDELSDPYSFDLVITVCDQAAETCANYPFGGTKIHVSIKDPSGQDMAAWHETRDQLERVAKAVATAAEQNRIPSSEELLAARDSLRF